MADRVDKNAPAINAGAVSPNLIGENDVWLGKSGVHAVKRVTVAQDDVARARGRNGNRSGVLELRYRTRNRFNGEAKIIGDVLARHRQIEFADANAFRHFQEEADDPLPRVLHQQHDMILRVLQLRRSHPPELTGNLLVACGERDYRAAPYYLYFGLGNRFSGEGVLAAKLEAEDIARQVE